MKLGNKLNKTTLKEALIYDLLLATPSTDIVCFGFVTKFLASSQPH